MHSTQEQRRWDSEISTFPQQTVSARFQGLCALDDETRKQRPLPGRLCVAGSRLGCYKEYSESRLYGLLITLTWLSVKDSSKMALGG